jgi:hypothetical protein
MVNASVTSSVRMFLATDQPTTFRENPSITVARYTQPYVFSLGYRRGVIGVTVVV